MSAFSAICVLKTDVSNLSVSKLFVSMMVYVSAEFAFKSNKRLACACV
jgi:hypothetical protein